MTLPCEPSLEASRGRSICWFPKTISPFAKKSGLPASRRFLPFPFPFSLPHQKTDSCLRLLQSHTEEARRKCPGDRDSRYGGGRLIIHRNKGQALLEIVSSIPILLVLLLGTYTATRTSFLKSRAESAAFTQTLRSGRNYQGIERELSMSITPEQETVDIRSGSKRDRCLLPAPFPSLAGSTTGTVEIRKRWNEIGAPRWMPTVKIFQQVESNVDCWGKDTSSGERVRRWVNGIVLLGVVH